MTHTFLPDAGNGTLVATFSGTIEDEKSLAAWKKREIEAIQQGIEDDRSFRECRALMHQKHSFAG